MNRRDFFALSATTAASFGCSSAQAETTTVPLLSFGLITDVQFADIEPNGERHYRASVPKLKAAVASLAKLNPPFTLHLGDFVDRNFSSFGSVLPLLDPLGHPVHHLLGNHDYDLADSEKARVVSTLSMPHDYYMVRHSGVRLLMLDTTDLAAYKHPAASAQAKAAGAQLSQLAATQAANAQPWNGGLGTHQLAWLARELAAADAAGEKVILCGHHPLLPADAHQIWNAAAVLELIDQHPCVIAYFNGHNHAGAETVREGIPYLTFKSILHHPNTTAFSVIQLFSDRLAITGHGREASRSFPLRSVQPQKAQ
jgi:manganese-dependent ADP-ribose/CDP-alcohol diphosphatase